MMFRFIKVKSDDPGENIVKGIMFSYRAISFIIFASATISLTAIGYTYAKFKEKTKYIHLQQKELKRESGLISSIIADNNRLIRRLRQISKEKREDARKQYIAIYGKAGKLHLNMIDAFTARKWDETIKICQEMQKIGKLDITMDRDYLLKLASCQFYLGKIAESEQTIQTALQRHPNFLPFLQRKADLLMFQQKFAQAKPIVEKIAQKKPSPGSILARGNLYWGLEQYEKAAADYKAVLATGNHSQERASANNLALIYASRLQDFRLAEFYVNVLLGLDPASIRTLSTVGRISLLQGNLIRAERFLIKVHQMRPDNPEVLVNLSLLYKIKGDKTLEEKYLEMARNCSKDWQKIYKQLDNVPFLENTQKND